MVKYENLRVDPKGEFYKIFEFLGVDPGDEVIASAMEATSFERLKRAQPQTKSGSTFFRKGRAGEWRKSFSAADVTLFKRCTGGLLQELGYESDGTWRA